MKLFIGHYCDDILDTLIQDAVKNNGALFAQATCTLRLFLQGLKASQANKFLYILSQMVIYRLTIQVMFMCIKLMNAFLHCLDVLWQAQVLALMRQMDFVLKKI